MCSLWLLQLVCFVTDFLLVAEHNFYCCRVTVLQRKFFSIILIRLNAIYICLWLNDLCHCRLKLISPSSKLIPWILLTVDAQDRMIGYWTVLILGSILFFLRRKEVSTFSIGTQLFILHFQVALSLYQLFRALNFMGFNLITLPTKQMASLFSNRL